MKHAILMVLACVAALGLTESEVESEVDSIVEPMGTADSLYYPRAREEGRHHIHRNEHEERDRYSHIHPQDHRDPQKIVERVYSPDYYEPTVVLDYRYLKSGGRDYVRGPGGQILILPKGIRSHEHKEFRDYDSLIEHLRLKNNARIFQEEDVSRINQIDAHRPRFNQRDDNPHGYNRQEHYQNYPTFENQWHK